MSTLKTVHDLFVDEIKDLYSAEKQLIKAIPKMRKGAENTEMADAFAAHFEDTKNQVTRLEEIGKKYNFTVSGKKCKGMEGVVEEGQEALDQSGESSIKDLAIAGAACRVEHYEMAGYLSAIALAEHLGYDEAVTKLNESLAEEQAAESTVSEIAGRILSGVEESHLTTHG